MRDGFIHIGDFFFIAILCYAAAINASKEKNWNTNKILTPHSEYDHSAMCLCMQRKCEMVVILSKTEWKILPQAS